MISKVQNNQPLMPQQAPSDSTKANKNEIAIETIQIESPEKSETLSGKRNSKIAEMKFAGDSRAEQLQAEFDGKSSPGFSVPEVDDQVL